MSLTSVGFAFGALVVPVVAWSMVTLGWRETATISGIVVLVVGLPASQMFRRTPEEYGLLPDGGPQQTRGVQDENRAPATRAASSGETSFTVREAMRDRSFWFIAVDHGNGATGGGDRPGPPRPLPRGAERLEPGGDFVGLSRQS